MATSGAIPRVSIGLPVFNGETFLEQSLAALLSQSYREFELVIVDNASTDGTEIICREFADRDARVRYCRNAENRGAAWNFNRAFTLTAGEYFKWAAYDDLCEPTFVERCLNALQMTPEAVLAYPKTRLIDENGATRGDHEDALALPQATPHERLRTLVAALAYTNPVYGLIRADALRRTRLLGSYPSADYVLLVELALLGTFVEVPERLFLRRIHAQMSREANPSAGEAALWFQTDARAGFRTEAWRLCAEHMVAIARAPLPPVERVLCALTFAKVGGRRYAHHLARELKEVVLLTPTAARKTRRAAAKVRKKVRKAPPRSRSHPYSSDSNV